MADSEKTDDRKAEADAKHEPSTNEATSQADEPKASADEKAAAEPTTANVSEHEASEKAADESGETDGEEEANPYAPREETRRKKKRRRVDDDLAAESSTQDDSEEEQAASGEDEETDATDEDEEEDPYPWIPWWGPHAVLGALILTGLIGFFGGFRKAPPAEETKKESTTPAATAPTTLNLPSNRPPLRPVGQQPQGEQIGAQHLLVQYKGAMRAPATVTRTKEEAQKRAQEALDKLKKGTPFDQLVKDYSDEPGAGSRNPPGDLGMFGRGRMDPAFEAGAFALKPGETSGLVESKFGYHIIKRTK